MVPKQLGRPLAWTELPDRQPGPGEIRFRVSACGAEAPPQPQMGVVYPLQQANEALADLRAGRVDGAAVLLP